MCFREAGLRFLHGEALASLEVETHKESTDYKVTIDPEFDNLDELNEVWKLDQLVIDRLKQETGSVRQITMVKEKEVVTPRSTTMGGSDLSPLALDCRDHTQVGDIKTNLVSPLNPVLKEENLLQKFPLRAGIRHRNTACPHQSTVQYLRTTPKTSSERAQAVTGTKGYHSTSSTENVCSAHREGLPCDTRLPTPQPRRGLSQGHQDVTSLSTTWQSSRVQLIPTFVSLSVDGVTHYDSTT